MMKHKNKIVGIVLAVALALVGYFFGPSIREKLSGLLGGDESGDVEEAPNAPAEIPAEQSEVPKAIEAPAVPIAPAPEAPKAAEPAPAPEAPKAK